MSTFELSSILSVFEGSITFEWGPHNDEPTIIANKLEMIAEELEHAELPMYAARNVIIEDKDERFATETDPTGKKWKKRSKATLDQYRYRKETYQGILEKDGDLRAAVTDPNSYEVVDNDLFINTANWPVYWHIHDVGGTAGRGAQIPARPFMGTSSYAATSIVRIFDEWMAGAIDIIKPGITGIAMFRGAFGHIAGPAHRGPRRRIAPLGSPSAREHNPLG